MGLENSWPHTSFRVRFFLGFFMAKNYSKGRMSFNHSVFFMYLNNLFFINYIVFKMSLTEIKIWFQETNQS